MDFIEANFVCRMTDAWKHFGALKVSLDELQWRICYRADLHSTQGSCADAAKRHCRELLKELDFISSSYRDVEAPFPYEKKTVRKP